MNSPCAKSSDDVKCVPALVLLVIDTVIDVATPEPAIPVVIILQLLVNIFLLSRTDLDAKDINVRLGDISYDKNWSDRIKCHRLPLIAMRLQHLAALLVLAEKSLLLLAKEAGWAEVYVIDAGVSRYYSSLYGICVSV